MPLLDGFLSHSQMSPEHIALTQGDRSLNYSQLHQMACRVAANLTQKNCHEAAHIAIALDRGIDAVAAILGVLYCGYCYVPLDLNNPSARLGSIVKDACAQVIIGQGQCPDWCQNKNAWMDLDRMEDRPTDFQIHQGLSHELSAILYTSGSTGTPKGVALSLNAMWAFAEWAGQRFKVEQNDQVASLSPFFFDLSVFDLFTVLNFGATVNFIPNGLTLSPSRLSGWLKANRISIWYTVPSILSFLGLKGNLAKSPLLDLRCLLFAGEVFPTPHLVGLLELLPNVSFFNLFGPTETNVCCFWPVNRLELNLEKAIPIGGPACEAQLRIDDSRGELLVKGPAVFSGYWIKDGLASQVDGDGWFRTGDRVSLNSKGELLYHGRLDRMIKCSGYRVEPAEVESNINSIDGVIQSAVIGIKDTVGGCRPAAIVVLSASYGIGELRSTLQRRLPTYMVPAKIIAQPSLPQLANGKVDYGAVKKLLGEGNS